MIVRLHFLSLKNLIEALERNDESKIFNITDTVFDVNIDHNIKDFITYNTNIESALSTPEFSKLTIAQKKYL